MSRNLNREEYLRVKAEQIRLKKEKEALEERAIYERATTGLWWLSFKIVVVVSTFMAVATLVDHLFDGRIHKLDEQSWKIDQDWSYPGHSVVNIDGYLFTPDYYHWAPHVENTIQLTRTPIFRTGKKLTFDTKVNGNQIVQHTELRWRSIFDWFPFVQIMFFIPLVTFIFKQQSPWFNLGRIISYTVVIPCAFAIYFYALR